MTKDIVIIGGSIAGLECAKSLGGSNKSVLVIEREDKLGEKACAAGILPEDEKYIPSQFTSFAYQPLRVVYGDKEVTMSKDGSGMITSIDRPALLDDKLKHIEEFSNITVWKGRSVSQITPEKVVLSDGESIGYKYLVGADGSSSLVRRYLKLPSEEMLFTMQYWVPKRFDRFEVFFEEKLFKYGYAWVFPNADDTSIGCGMEVRSGPRKLREKFDQWLRSKGIDTKGARFQAHLINCHYLGYRFNNIYLIGDAAGLACGATGKGIYSAHVSAQHVADELMGKKPNGELEKWLGRKRRQEEIFKYMRNNLLRGFLISLGIFLLRFPRFQKKLLGLVSH